MKQIGLNMLQIDFEEKSTNYVEKKNFNLSSQTFMCLL